MFTLHNGDCLQVMPLLEAGSIDAIITDLPYGTTACKWDTIIPFEPMWKEVKRVLKPNGAFITTASQPFTSSLIMSNPKAFRYEWIWDKVNRVTGYGNANKSPLKRHDNICVFYWKSPTYNPQFVQGKAYVTSARKGTIHRHLGKNGITPQRTYSDGKRYPQDILTIKADIKTEMGLHPTQKPVALYEYLIKTYTNEGETVLDICMGSGTTIEAAERTGRNSIGIEKDEGIFQSAVLRLKSFTPSNNRLHLDVGDSPAQGSLFTPEADTAEGKSPTPAPRR